MKKKILFLSLVALGGFVSLKSVQASDAKSLFVESDNIALANEPRWGCRATANWTCAEGLILIEGARYAPLAPWED